MGPSGSNEIPETPYERQLANISKAKWNDYKKRYIPFENKWIADVTADPAARVESVQGQTNANMAQQARSITSPQAIDPNLGAVKSGAAMSKLGAATGKAVAQGGEAAKNQQVAGEEAAVALGRGTSTNAELGYGNLAQNASQSAINSAYNEFRDMSSLSQGIGQAAGMATRYMLPNNTTETINH
jgi:hypothetical protein